MSDSSAISENNWEGRYLNVNCGCGRKAGIKIYENEQNKNRLYYYCMSGKCIGSEDEGRHYTFMSDRQKVSIKCIIQ